MALAQGLKGRLFKQIRKAPGGTGFLQKGGADLIGQSLPGAILTTGLTTLATGITRNTNEVCIRCYSKSKKD